MSTQLNFPNTVKLVLDKNIKLHLQHSKVVKFQSGALAWVATTFGAGIYGIFDQQTGALRLKHDFAVLAADIKTTKLHELEDVEARGLEAINEIGVLTGSCCICGRTLTADESIAGGIGPICGGKVGWKPEVQL